MKKTIILSALAFIVSIAIISSCKKNTEPESTCSDEHIHINNNGCCLFAPNIFSPDSNGINDLYMVSAQGNTSFSLTIKDANQNVLFTSNSTSSAWDGTVNNQIQAEAQYEAHIQASFPNCSIDTTHCFYLGKYNSGCIPKYSSTNLIFPDQFDPVGCLVPFPSADSLCP